LKNFRDGLVPERGHAQSENVLCLFMKEGILCVVYVDDDTIFTGGESAILKEEIGLLLGVSSNTERRQHTKERSVLSLEFRSPRLENVPSL
jgi:hypothetical protein